MRPFGTHTGDWPLAKLNVDLEELGERGATAGWTDSQASTVHDGGAGPATSKYSDLSYNKSGETLYNDISAYGQESDWQHITIHSGSTQCGTATADRVIHNSVYSNPNVSKTDVITVYQSDVLDVAHTNQDSAVFYDGTANWHGLNANPCNPATATDWVHLDFAHQLVGTFLNNETTYETPNIPFFVNENGNVDLTPQAAETVRGMIGVSILGVKVEATSQLSEPMTWQSFEDDELLGAQQGWKTVWEYDAFASGGTPADHAVEQAAAETPRLSHVL